MEGRDTEQKTERKIAVVAGGGADIMVTPDDFNGVDLMVDGRAAKYWLDKIAHRLFLRETP